MSTLLAVLAVAAGSFVLRFAPLVVAGAAPSEGLQRVATHAGTAALAGLVVAGLTRHGSTGSAGGLPALLVAAAGAAVVARRRRSLVAVLVAGLGGYWTVVVTATVLT